jgi:glycosyltransferase involved in cell wall biosynthesis
LVILPDSHDWTSLGTGGGIETFLKMFLDYAPELQLRVTVLCSGPRAAVVGPVRYVPILSHAASELAFTRRLKHELAHHKIVLPENAVVLANTEHYAWAFRGQGLPIVLMSHGIIAETLRMRYSGAFVSLFRFFIERYAVLHAKHLIAVSSGLRESYLERYPSLRQTGTSVVPIGVDLRDLDRRPRTNPLRSLNLDSDSPIVLFVGRLYPEKNIQLFIAACDETSRRGSKFEAVVVGDGVEAAILKTAMKSRPWLHWIPKLEHSEVLDAMALSRVLAICSRYEAGPLVLLEAIGLGTSVVTTDVGRARELVREPVGLIMRSDPVDFAEGLCRFLGQGSSDAPARSDDKLSVIDFRKTMESLVGVLRAVARSGSTDT